MDEKPADRESPDDQIEQTLASNDASAAPPRSSRADTDEGGEATLASANSPASSRTSPIGREFADFELLEEIARGGMGVVYRARQKSLDRIVALKMILAGQLAGEQEVLRFQSEAQAAANLEHPGIVPIYEIGEYQGQHYFSMGYVDGESLASRVARGPLAPAEAAELLIAVTDAVHYAHQHQIVHRDLKPANVLLKSSGEEEARTDELENSSKGRLSARARRSTLNARPLVTDFGLAKQLSGDSELTGTGQILGTPSYMAPEQAAGMADRVGPLADVYALGAILYCLLTGRPPFQAANSVDTLLQVLQKEVVSPRRLNQSVPVDLETICLKCLEKEPERRYASARALSFELQRFVNGEPIQARPTSAAVRVWRWCRREPALAALGATVLTLLLILGVVGPLAAIQQRIIATRQTRFAQQELALRQEADDARQDAESKRDELQYQDYVNRVSLALRECESNNVARAMELLDGCPEKLRGWEWEYVRRQCHLDLMTFGETDPSINCVAFSPDGRHLAYASGNFFMFQADPSGSLVVRDVATGREAFRQDGLEGGVTALAYSPDGRWIATGNRREITIWSAHNGEPQRRMQCDLNVMSLSFSPDSQKLLAGCGQFFWDQVGHARLLDVESGRAIGNKFPGHVGGVWSTAFSPDGELVALTSTGRVDVWQLEPRELLHTLRGQTGLLYAVAFSPDGRDIAAGGLDETISLWDRESGRPIRTFAGHQGFVRGLAFSPDGRRLVSASEDKSVKLWDVSSERELTTLHGHAHYVQCVAYSPDGRFILSGSFDQTAKLWSATSSHQLTYHGHRGQAHVTGLAAHPGGQLVVSSTFGATDRIHVWDYKTGERHVTFPESGGVGQLVLSADGRRLVSAHRGRQGVHVWDFPSAMSVRHIPGPGFLFGIALSRDGSRIAATTPNDQITINIWNADTGSEVASLAGHSARVTGLAFNPRSELLASASYDGTVRLWDLNSGKQVRVMRGHAGRVECVTFSEDGSWIVSGGGISERRGEICLWETATGRLLRQLEGHTNSVMDVDFSPDGMRLASASYDRTIKLWDTEMGQEVITLRGHTAGVASLAFSPDGRTLISGGLDRTVRTWELEPPSASTLSRREAEDQTAQGYYFLNAKQPERALQAFTSAIAILDNPLRRVGRGRAYAALSQTQPAAADLRTAIELAPEDPLVLADLGRLLAEPDVIHLSRQILEEGSKLFKTQAVLCELYGHQSIRLRREGRQQQVIEVDLLRRDLLQQLVQQSRDNRRFAQQLADSLLARPDEWAVVQPRKLHSSGDATLETQPDGSVLVSGKNPDHDSYTIECKVDLKRVTALKLELIPDAALPHGGIGRFPGNGNGHLSRFVVHVASENQPADRKSVVISRAYADYAQPNCSIQNAIDGNRRTRWDTYPLHRERRVAIFEFAEPFGVEQGAKLTVVIDAGISPWPNHGLGRFRLSVTTRPHPVFRQRIRDEPLALENAFSALAVAYYLSGDLSAAAEAARISVELADGGNRYDWCVLAVASAKSGDQTSAQNWSGKVKSLSGAADSGDELLTHFLGEVLRSAE